MKHTLFYTAALFFVVSNVLASSEINIKLPPCPEKPNCVSSQAKPRSDQYIAPFKIKGSNEQAWVALKDILNNQSRTKITKNSNDSIDAEVRSLVFRFVDDVQFRLDQQKSMIHVRSASRAGYSDLGVNRKRVEKIRQQLRQAGLIE